MPDSNVPIEEPVLGVHPDTKVEENERGRLRTKRASSTAICASIARLTNALIMLTSVPLTSQYLGHERYGVWLTISSFIALLAFADLGIGVGLLNAVSEANGKDDTNKAREHISTAFVLLGCICGVLLLTAGVSYPFVSWASLFNVSSADARREVGPAVMVFLVATSLNLPLTIVQRVQLGYQVGWRSYLWQAFGSLLGLGCLLVAVQLQLGLTWLVAAYMVAPTLSLLLNGVFYFGIQHPELRPKLSMYSRTSTKLLTQVGSAFVILQLLSALVNNMDFFIIAHRLSQVEVAQYSLTIRLFAFIMMILGFATAALWPAFAESSARGDHGWTDRTYKTAVKVGYSVTIVGTCVLLMFGDKLINIWSRGVVEVGLALLIPRAFYTVTESVVSVTGTLLSALGKVWIQIASIGSYVLLSALIKPTIAEHYGVTGVAWVSTIAFIACVAVPLRWGTGRVLARQARTDY
jgi:O-antigen/teichoic acid export membrane protein